MCDAAVHVYQQLMTAHMLVFQVPGTQKATAYTINLRQINYISLNLPEKITYMYWIVIN